jgi:hypothetical protein
VTSGALPPIPAKIMEKVRAGKYVDFREMLPDNVALLEQLSTLGNSNPAPTTARLRELKDPLSWVFCFMYYIIDSTERDWQLVAHVTCMFVIMT